MCCTCCVPSISIFNHLEEWGGPVPEGCLRYTGPLFGSSLDCGRCTKDRQEIQERHPLYQERVDATREVFKGFLQRVRDEPEDELASRRATKRWADLLIPSKTSFADEDPDNPSDAMLHADLVFQVVQNLAMADAELGELLNELKSTETWRWDLMIAEWAEAIYLAVRHHGPDPEKVTREFILTYTRGFARRMWASLSLAEKTRRIDEWTEYIGQALAIDLEAIE